MERGERIESSHHPEDPVGASSRMLASLTQQERDQAMERYRVIRPFLEEGIPLAEIAMHRQEAVQTLRRWVHSYRLGGLAGLARKERADAGKHRRLSDEARRKGWPFRNRPSQRLQSIGKSAPDCKRRENNRLATMSFTR